MSGENKYEVVLKNGHRKTVCSNSKYLLQRKLQSLNIRVKEIKLVDSRCGSLPVQYYYQ